MPRQMLDRILTSIGALLTVLLVVAGGLMLWAHTFVDSNVHKQLSQQRISFPPKGSPALSSDPEIKKYVTPYAGQQVVNGQQAEVFADHYIAVHLREIGGGKTYSEVSGAFLQMKPTDPNYQQVAQTRTTLFQGETLRGLLLNAYAFWKMGQLALIGAIVSFVLAALMAVLTVLGFVHMRRAQAATGDYADAELAGTRVRT